MKMLPASDRGGSPGAVRGGEPAEGVAHYAGPTSEKKEVHLALSRSGEDSPSQLLEH